MAHKIPNLLYNLLHSLLQGESKAEVANQFKYILVCFINVLCCMLLVDMKVTAMAIVS